MRIELISHASVVIRAEDVAIWSDPWLWGEVFNDSWALFPEAVFEPSLLDEIQYLWISHEHPDHFNLPTLRSLPERFRRRVTVLFQENNSTKIFEVLEGLGYRNLCALPHARRMRLSDQTTVYCYQVGQMDSCLGVLCDGEVVLNVNDAGVNKRDCRRIRRDIGAPDVVLNQFSIAGYAGFEDYRRHLPALARHHLDGMVQNHRDLGARITIPFASFIRFCTHDNRYVNQFANRPRAVHERFRREDLVCHVLYPGDSYDTRGSWDSGPALGRFDELYASLPGLETSSPASVSLDEIEAAFREIRTEILRRFPRTLLRLLLRSVAVRIPDLETTVEFDIRTGRFEPARREPDIAVHSQPLLFAFSQPYGMQTLGVSARLVLMRRVRNWYLHRALFALYNAELYLRPRYLLRWRTLRHLCNRWRGLTSQVATRLIYLEKGR